MAQRKVYVVGVGMSKFMKPQKDFDPDLPDYPEFAKTAVERALSDACISYKDIEMAAVGSMFGMKGQRVLYDIGMTGIPIHNVMNACATGSNALYLARSFVMSGMNECVLALGVEKMQPGSLGGGALGKGATMLDHHFTTMIQTHDPVPAPPMPQMFGNAGREHMAKYGSTARDMAMIGEKNHRHSLNNPYSQFQDLYTLEQVEKSPMVHEPLTKLQCSPTSDGAAAAVICSEAFVIKHGLQGQAIEIAGQSMRTDEPSAFEGGKDTSAIHMVGFSMARTAAQEAFGQAQIHPTDVQVIELHDCFSSNELLTYEALGLAPVGKGHELVRRGDVTYGGKWVVNPSGGLISKGHPLGATGLAQCCELNWQLRGEAGKRQVPNARYALQHNLGLGGAVVVTIYKKPDQWKGVPPKRKVSGAMGFQNSRL